MLFKRLLAYHADLIRALVAINAVVVVAGIYEIDSAVLASGFAALQFVFIWLAKVSFNRDLEELQAEQEAISEAETEALAKLLGLEVIEPVEAEVLPGPPPHPLGFGIPDEDASA